MNTNNIKHEQANSFQINKILIVMTAQHILYNYSKYNLWANGMMTQWLLSKDHGLMDVELNSSFPTINKTLSHIWVAEYIWMCRIEGIVGNKLSGRHDGKEISGICHDLLEVSQYYIKKSEEISENDLSQKFRYKYLSGDEGESELIDILHHVMNHSTYHRGQLVTMGRELGFTDPPKTDYIQYVREKSV